MTYDLFQVETIGNPPAHRTYHAATLLDNFMVIIGGEGVNNLNDVHILNLDTKVWHNIDIN